MKHFLLAELYRMKSSKSPLILLLVCFGLSFTAGITYGLAFGNAPFLTDFYSFLFGGMDPGVTELLSGNHVDTLVEFAALGFNGNVELFLVIFIAVFLLPLKRSGFIKNIASEFTRTQMFFTHVILILLYSFLLTDVAAFAMLLNAGFFFRDVPVGNIGAFIVHILMVTLIISAIVIVVLTVSELLRKPMTAVIFAIVYILIGAPMLFSMSDILTGLNSGRTFRLQYISLVGNLSLLSVGKWDTVISALIVVLGYTALAILLQMTVLKRKDLI